MPRGISRRSLLVGMGAVTVAAGMFIHGAVYAGPAQGERYMHNEAAPPLGS
jgi:hypothetical protein